MPACSLDSQGRFRAAAINANCMKLKLLAMAAGLALAISGGGCAHQKDATRDSADNPGDQYHYATGSYLPQDVKKSGPVTNGKDNLRIIDRSEIDRSGGADVGQTLRQLGATH